MGFCHRYYVNKGGGGTIQFLWDITYAIKNKYQFSNIFIKFKVVVFVSKFQQHAFLILNFFLYLEHVAPQIVVRGPESSLIT